MARIQLKNVSKRWTNFVGVKEFSLDIADQEFLVLLGPSGCGKTTTMRMIAGLEDVSDGEIWIGDRLVNKLEPKDRDISMVFQSYGLYPNMTVYENIRFPLRVRKVPQEQHHERVMKASAMVELDDFLQRRPAALSGGQRQRVALARAIVREPNAFLMDEPLSNLDAKLRVSTRAQIKNLHHTLKTTTIYVTHDQIEAMTLADRIVLLKDGVIEQQGAPLDLFERPATRFVAGFLGSPQMNFVPCRLEEGTLHFGDGRTLPLPPTKAARLDPYRGRAMTLGIRPEHFSRAGGGTPRPGQVPLRVTVELVQPTGTRTYATFRLGEAEVSAELPAHTVEGPGTELDLLADLDRAILIDPETDRVI